MQPRTTLFTAYDFTEEESKEAVNFNSLQRAYLQTLLATSAEKKVALTFDPKNAQEHIQIEAELHGEMNILSWLLGISSVTPHAVSQPKSETEGE